MKNPKKNQSSKVRRRERGSGITYRRCPTCGSIPSHPTKCVNADKNCKDDYNLTAIHWRTTINHVTNEAKIHPNIITKTNELKTLILDKGLFPIELCNVNMADVPCSHHEPKIVVYNRWNDGWREIFLDETLENKVNEYVEIYRKDAKPEDPFLITRIGTRLSPQNLWKTFALKPDRENRIGIGPRLDINYLTAGIFRRTLKYQFVGKSNQDEKTKKKRLKSKIAGVTIREFLRDFCKGPLSEGKIKRYKNGIKRAWDREPTLLPKPIGSWRPGQAFRFNPLALISCWDEIRDTLPYLPALDSKRIENILKSA